MKFVGRSTARGVGECHGAPVVDALVAPGVVRPGAMVLDTWVPVVYRDCWTRASRDQQYGGGVHFAAPHAHDGRGLGPTGVRWGIMKMLEIV